MAISLWVMRFFVQIDANTYIARIDRPTVKGGLEPRRVLHSGTANDMCCAKLRVRSRHYLLPVNVFGSQIDVEKTLKQSTKYPTYVTLVKQF